MSLGINPLTQKRDTKTRRFAGTYTEALKALEEFRAELDSGINIDAMYVTFREYATNWKDARALNNELSKSTQRKDSVHVRTLISCVGNLKMRDITPQIVSNVHLALRSGEGSMSGKPLSGASARSISVTFKSIMQEAVAKEIIPKNPCANIKLPKVDTVKKRHCQTNACRRWQS